MDYTARFGDKNTLEQSIILEMLDTLENTTFPYFSSLFNHPKDELNTFVTEYRDKILPNKNIKNLE